MKFKIVENVLKNSLGMKKREKLLIVTDNILSEIGEFFYQNSKKLGYEPVILKYFPRRIHGEEPPPVIGSVLQSVDVALLLTAKSLSHTRARKNASKRGTRIASLPGITFEVVKRTLKFDYRKIKSRVENLAQKLTSTKQIRVKTSAGTDIQFSVEKRKGFPDTGVYKNRGDFGNLPAGEVCIAPVEGRARGEIVVDASIAGIGKVNKPFILKIERGYLVKSIPGYFKKFLVNYGKKGTNLAEFGIGLNPDAIITGNVLEDEKVKGTCHFAFGSNISFGGKVDAGIHIDVVLFKPKIYLDGQLLKI